MGLDVASVAGFTVYVTDEEIERLCEEYDKEDAVELFDFLHLEHGTYGSAYSGETKTVPLLVPSPKNVDAQIQVWLTEVNLALKRSNKTQYKLKDVEFISQTYWW